MPEIKGQTELRGLVVPLLTAFHPDESVNGQGTVNLAEYLVDEGVQGLIVGGSSAEAIGMSVDERKHLAELLVSRFRERVPVCIGTGTYLTQDTLDLSRHAQSIGADSILVIPPYYMGLTRSQVRNHFEELAANIEIPIILYDNPVASGVRLSGQEVAEYFNDRLIQGVKLTLENGDASQVHDLRYMCGSSFRIFYGADTSALEGLLCGADGWVSTLVNLLPKASRLLCDAALAGKRDKAVLVWEAMLPIIHFESRLDVNREPHWLSLVKSGLEVLGHSVGVPRRPLLPLTLAQRQQLTDLLSNLEDASVLNQAID